jgi:hypothetical protein
MDKFTANLIINSTENATDNPIDNATDVSRITEVLLQIQRQSQHQGGGPDVVETRARAAIQTQLIILKNAAYAMGFKAGLGVVTKRFS